MRRRRLAVAAVAAIAAVALAGCGSGSSAPPPPGAGANVGASINLADCRDWNQANTAERLGTLQQLKNFAGGPVVGVNGNAPAGRGAVLDDKKAYDILTNYCKPDFARGFKLYKLYDRAASFAGQPAQ